MPIDAVHRAILSFDGLSVGDAFGQCFFAYGTDPYVWNHRLASREIPPGQWVYTDDTEMALGICEVLNRHGRIDQDDLAGTFARRYARDDRRGYGGMAHRILMEIRAGVAWRDATTAAFDGHGSLGNGGAMRVAPLGAWFADAPIETLIEEARLSAEVTHAHAEGQAGAIAIALAAAFAARQKQPPGPSLAMLEYVRDHTPGGKVRDGIVDALDTPFDMPIETAAARLGDGSKVTAPDTVPFCLWCVAHHHDDYVEALWSTVAAGGDIDTNCAIVGGVVALSAREGHGIPPAWLSAREALQFE